MPSTASLSSRPNAATVGALEALPAVVGHPVYWAGPQTGIKYELTRTSAGRIFLRYLPRAAAVGDKQAAYLTMATYAWHRLVVVRLIAYQERITCD